jgi:hypothetical protein
MLDGQQFGGVVYRAIPVVIVANGAIEQVISQNPVERFPLGGLRFGGFRQDVHSGGGFGGASTHQLAIHLNHASVTALNWTELRVITNLRKLSADSINEIDEPLVRFRFGDRTING